MNFDVVIIGGGAAGLFCAITAGKRGKKVLVIEHNAEVGRKIIISGGGRCNFTNLNVGPENFISQNPHFCKSALAGYTPVDFIELVKKHRIEYYEKKLGQLFCRESSRQIVDMLVAECRRGRVEIRTSCGVSDVRGSDGQFDISTTQGDLSTAKLVVACGGLSFPKVGASDLGYRLARQYGLKIVETRPSLVALVSAKNEMKELAGVSIDSNVMSGKQQFRENILFTHRGLSGPAILQISNYWRPNEPVFVDLLPDVDTSTMMAAGRQSKMTLGNFLAKRLPQRFSDMSTAAFTNKPVDQLSNREINELVEILTRWKIYFSETEGYGRAEVTCGGVSTAELSSKTMESKKVRGLYFIGEVVDVTGWLGGYNFQWAWASGLAAGNAI